MKRRFHSEFKERATPNGPEMMDSPEGRSSLSRPDALAGGDGWACWEPDVRETASEAGEEMTEDETTEDEMTEDVDFAGEVEDSSPSECSSSPRSNSGTESALLSEPPAGILSTLACPVSSSRPIKSALSPEAMMASSLGLWPRRREAPT